MLEELRRMIPGEEFDYLALLEALTEFERPRKKITSLLRKGEIIRVKKGIYVFGKRHARRPYSREILANMIYGPSYISLESALQYHGLIPEQVEAMTSVTPGRSRRFTSPVGLFTYKSIPMKAYSIGFDQVNLDDARFFLIAVPEKALADKLQEDRGVSIRNQREMQNYLSENLRIDMKQLAGMDGNLVAETADRYRSRKLRMLSKLIFRLRSQR